MAQRNRPVCEQWSDDLSCYWMQWRAVGDRKLAIDLPPHSCTDMTGAIKVATAIMPNVDEIATFSGDRPDTIYRRTGNVWRAVMPPGMRVKRGQVVSHP